MISEFLQKVLLFIDIGITFRAQKEKNNSKTCPE